MRLKWNISLNNGQNFTEGVGIFSVVEGELSPWLKLEEYLLSNDLKITSLSIISDDGKTFNLPSLGKNPKFRAFLTAPKPLYYNFGRVIGNNISGGDLEVFARIEAVYENYKLQLWVNENNPDSCHVLVI